VATNFSEFIGVYADEPAAQAAADAAVDAGADRQSLRVDAAIDEREALRSEMREESEHTIAGPGSVGPFTKEMTKGIAVGVPIATVIGAIIGLGVGLIPWANVGLVFRMITGAACGALAGAVVGFYGGGLAAKGPAEPLAAERGTTVRIVAPLAASDAVAAALSRFSPIRLDMAGRDEWATVTTEEEQGSVPSGNTAETLRDRVVQGQGDWSHVQSQERADARDQGR
jgi:hypothetical protein